MSDLEELIRTTLAGRAATVHSGPDLPVVTGGGPRHPRWLPAAAAATVVAALAAGLVAWHASGDGPADRVAAGPAGTVCMTTLPGSWTSARSDTPLTVDGRPATPWRGDAAGDLVVDWSAGGQDHLGLLAADGRVTPVVHRRNPGDSGFGAVGTDGASIVYTLHADSQSPVGDLVVADVRTGAVTHLLPGAPVPAGWVVAAEGVVQDGDVYWSATPPNDDSRGVVLRYSIAERRYTVLARTTGYPWVVGDERGVGWAGGSAPLPGVPHDLPPLLDTRGRPAVRFASDGRTYAWQTVDGDQDVYRWADRSGTLRSFRFAPGTGLDGGGISAVSGPFVVLHFNNPSGPTDFVVDTRTVAAAPIQGAERSYPLGQLFATADALEFHRVDTAALTGFRC